MGQLKPFSPKQVLNHYLMALVFFIFTLVFISLNSPYDAVFTGVAAVGIAYYTLRRIL